MTDAEIDAMIEEIDRMAQRIGCRFVPRPEKVMAFRQAHGTELARLLDQYKSIVHTWRDEGPKE